MEDDRVRAGFKSALILVASSTPTIKAIFKALILDQKIMKLETKFMAMQAEKKSASPRSQWWMLPRYHLIRREKDSWSSFGDEWKPHQAKKSPRKRWRFCVDLIQRTGAPEKRVDPW